MTEGGKERVLLLRHGLRLEYATLAWNVVGTVVVLVAAAAAGSVALVGFGLDSLIEIFASTVVVWNLKGVAAARERAALRLIGGAFCLLATYLAGQSAYTLLAGSRPGVSGPGIAWTAATCVVMVALARGKARTGTALGNAVLVTEGKVTLVDALLAGTVVLGLGANAAAGTWWADPLAALVVCFYGLREGVSALREASGSTPPAS